MDKRDHLILSELLKDAQLSFVTIAKKLGTSPYTIRKRYERMKEEGIIYKSVVSIDLSKLGYQGKVFLMITISPQRDKSKTISALEKIRNIFVITEIIGSFDILAIAPIIDLNSIRTIVNEINKLPDVQKVEITCINNTAFPISQSWGKLLSRKSYELATASTNF
jgi:DNA-binding Lrp family transcriptional regulator